jgi:hypothetical protein
MARQTVVPKKVKKKRGPPPTGKGTQIGTRWHAPLLQAIDTWAERQEDKPDRSESIRRLVQRGLASEGIDVPISAAADSVHTSKPATAAKALPPKKTRQRHSQPRY